MRRRFRSRSRGLRRNKKQWGNSEWWLHGTTAAGVWTNPTNTDVAIINNAWHKVPSGVFNTAAGEFENTDWLLLRSMPSWAVGWELSGGGIKHVSVCYAFGLIAWDQNNDSPVSLALQPNPIHDGNYDWLYRGVFQDVFSASAVVTPAGAYGAPRFDMQFDSRARRKLPTGTGLLACWGIHFQYADSSSAQTITWTMAENSRSLFALP